MVPPIPEQSYAPSLSPGLVGNNDYGAIGGTVQNAIDGNDDDPFSPFVVKLISPVAHVQCPSVPRYTGFRG